MKHKNNLFLKKKEDKTKALTLMGVSLLFIFLIFSISFSLALPNDSGAGITFTYPINYSLIPTVNSSDYWDALDTPADIHYDDLSGGDVNDIGYYGYFNGLGGVVGGLAMDGDPWYLGGTDLEIDLDLQVNNTYVEHDIMPTDTLTGNIGSGALRWLSLWVQSINAEDIDAYNLHLSQNLSVDGNFTVGGYINGINVSNLTGTYVPYIGATDDVYLGNYDLYGSEASFHNSGNFITNLSSSAVGSNFVSSNVINQIVRLGDANNVYAGYFEDNSGNTVILLDGSGYNTFNGAMNVFSTATRFDDGIDNPNDLSIRIVGDEEYNLNATDFYLYNNNLTTTGWLKVRNNSAGLNLGATGHYISYVNESSGGSGNVDELYMVTSNNGLGVHIQSAQTKFRIVADNAAAGRGYFQTGVTGGSTAGSMYFSGYGGNSAYKVVFYAGSTRFGNSLTAGSEKMDVDDGNFWLVDDNKDILLGNGKDFKIGWDASNGIINTTTGELYINNNTGLSIIHAFDFQTSTGKYDTSSGSALNKIRDASEYESLPIKIEEGITYEDHSVYGDCARDEIITDYSRPVNASQPCELINKDGNLVNSTCYEIKYPYTLTLVNSSISLECMRTRYEQAISEIKDFKDCIKSAKTFEEINLC